MQFDRSTWKATIREGGIIFVGVALALAAQAWWEGQADEIDARQYTANLLIELRANAEGLEAIITQHRERFEIDRVIVAEPVGVLRGEISVDASLNALAFCAHANGLGNFDPTVLLNDDVTMKFEDAFVGDRR